MLICMWHLNVRTGTHPTSSQRRRGEIRFLKMFYLRSLFFSHRRCLSRINNRRLLWNGFGLNAPRRAPVYSSSGTFGPCHKSWHSASLPSLFVFWTTCRQLESRLRSDLRWHCTRATAGPCFVPDVKGAKNQYQICCVDPCTRGGLPFN